MRFLLAKEHNEGAAQATVNKYRLALKRLEDFLGDVRLAEASAEQLREFVGLHMHRQGISPRARRPIISCIRGFYRWLRDQRIVRENPAEDLEYPRIGRRLPSAMQLNQVEQLLMAPDLEDFQGVRDLAMMMVLAGTGIRVSGLVAMNEGDLLWIEDGGLERLVIKVREKGGHERLVPAPDEVRLIVRAYLGHDELRSVDRTLPDGDAVLWISTRNRKVSPADYYGEARRLTDRAVCRIIERYGKAQGLPRPVCHPHALRHLYGTELAEHDVSTLIIQALMGHADPKTSEIYVHTAMRKLAQVVDKANPLGRVRTPVSDLARRLRRAPA